MPNPTIGQIVSYNLMVAGELVERPAIVTAVLSPVKIEATVFSPVQNPYMVHNVLEAGEVIASNTWSEIIGPDAAAARAAARSEEIEVANG
jgi:hypothetical protein